MARALNRPYIAPMIGILSIYVLGETVSGTVCQVLVGVKEYSKAGLLSIVRNSIRVIASVLLITVGLGIYGSLRGFSIASALTLAVSLTYVSKYLGNAGFKAGLLREVVKFSLPLYVPTILGLPLNQAVSIFLARYATNVELGNYSVASNLLVPLSIVSGAMATSIYFTLPLLVGRESKLHGVVYKATKYTSIVVLPITMGLEVFSKPLTYLVYGAQYSTAPAYLSLLALTGLTAVLSSYIIGPYPKSVGKSVKAMKISLVNYAIYIPLALLLIPTYRVIGLIVASIIASFSSTLYGIHILRRDFSLEIATKRNIIVLGVLSLPAVLAWLASFLPLSSIVVKFLLGLTMYSISLMLVLPIVVKKSEILELIEITKGIRVLSFIAPKILSIILIISNILSYAKSRSRQTS